MLRMKRILPVLIFAGAFAAGCAPQGEPTLTRMPFPDVDSSPHSPPRRETDRTPTPRPEPEQPQRTAETQAPRRRNEREWRYIVIHHSATERGNAATFDAAHRRRGWDGLGYHFVINNGAGGPDGNIEVGHRWHEQTHGAHCRTPGNEHNEYGIGICLVGDFSDRRPSRAQLRSLQNLVGRLASRYDIPPERVIGHGEAPQQSTACPGRHLQSYIERELRPWLRSRRAVAGR